MEKEKGQRVLTKKRKAILERLRALFLSEIKLDRPYWETEEELALYEEIFGQRILWKWQSVLKELSLLRWQPPEGDLLDWGCGPGVAARSFCSWAQEKKFKVSSCFFWDRSPIAMEYARTLLRKEFPRIQARIVDRNRIPQKFILLISHLLGELNDQGLEELLEIAQRASAILWVEPGTKSISKKLGKLRESLKEKFWVVAPCLHQQKCGLSEDEKNWCHFFASVPREIFHDPFWGQTQAVMGIDLSSAAYSYLVMDSRQIHEPSAELFRIVGTVRRSKGYSSFWCCQATGELCLRKYLHRHNAWLSQPLKKGKAFSTLAKNIGEDPPLCIPLQSPEQSLESIKKGAFNPEKPSGEDRVQV